MQACSSLSLSIAGINISVRADNTGLQFAAPEPVAKFITQQTSPDLEITTSYADLSTKQVGELILDSGGVWKLYREAERFWFLLSSPQIASHPYKTACFNSDFSEGRMYMHQSIFSGRDSVYPLEYPLDELLMIKLLGAGRGVLVHACGVVDADGRGYLFAGQSGAGKTTIARFWENQPGCLILSDDRIILRKHENRIYMYGTPWHGEAELSSLGSVPLTALFILKQAKENRIVEKSRLETVALLAARTFPPFYSVSGMEFTMQFCQEVVESVPCSELQFLPTPEIVDVARASLVSQTLIHL